MKVSADTTEKDGAILKGDFDLTTTAETHRSMMHLFQKWCTKYWNMEEQEYWDMLQEQMLRCPDKYRWTVEK